MNHNRYADLVGQTFNDWTVMEYSHQSEQSGNYMWKVRCACGSESVVPGSSLKHGRTKQCRTCAGRERGKKGLYSQGRKRGGDLYMIRVGDYVKIGVSNNVKRRIKDIESCCPFNAELIYHGVGEAKDEEMWHKRHAACHHRGEWFYMPK